MSKITTHCLVKNEENFIWYAIKSVIDYVDQIFIFDTGSTDATVEIIKKLIGEHPDKIIFEEKGYCDKKRHTELRQEMINRTTTDWFMILDGDEVWTDRGIKEAVDILNSNSKVECLVAPFYLCVGDIFHKYYKKGDFEILGNKDFFTPRFIKNIRGVHWSGDYNQDTLIFNDNQNIIKKDNTIILKFRYWHLTHLKRSSTDGDDYSSYGSRKEKRRLTYFLIGQKIKESIPEVFFTTDLKCQPLDCFKSLFNFFRLLLKKSLGI